MNRSLVGSELYCGVRTLTCYQAKECADLPCTSPITTRTAGVLFCAARVGTMLEHCSLHACGPSMTCALLGPHDNFRILRSILMMTSNVVSWAQHQLLACEGCACWRAHTCCLPLVAVGASPGWKRARQDITPVDEALWRGCTTSREPRRRLGRASSCHCCTGYRHGKRTKRYREQNTHHVSQHSIQWYTLLCSRNLAHEHALP